MTENGKHMSCQEFQKQLPDLIGSGMNISGHPHMQECELCRALVAELETIAEAARQLFPIEVEPPDDLWEQIETAIRKEDKAEPAARKEDQTVEIGKKTRS
jgi:hypothetical protein